MRAWAQAFLALGLVALALAGLYFKVEYAGWILFLAFLVLM